MNNVDLENVVELGEDIGRNDNLTEAKSIETGSPDSQKEEGEMGCDSIYVEDQRLNIVYTDMEIHLENGGNQLNNASSQNNSENIAIHGKTGKKKATWKRKARSVTNIDLNKEASTPKKRKGDFVEEHGGKKYRAGDNEFMDVSSSSNFLAEAENQPCHTL